MREIRLSQSGVRAGETISGDIIWTVPEELPKRAIASIGWRTEGRGDVNRATVQEISLDFSKFARGGNATIPFQFQIPFNGPVSYDGSLLRIIWEVNVEIDLANVLSKKNRQAVIFRVLPRRSF